MPESTTLTFSSLSVCWYEATSLIPPLRVNFSAFFVKLISICCNLFLSPQSRGSVYLRSKLLTFLSLINNYNSGECSSSTTRNVRLIFCCFAYRWNIWTMNLKTLVGSNIVVLCSNTPSLIVLRSSKSFTKPNMRTI